MPLTSTFPIFFFLGIIRTRQAIPVRSPSVEVVANPPPSNQGGEESDAISVASSIPPIRITAKTRKSTVPKTRNIPISNAPYQIPDKDDIPAPKKSSRGRRAALSTPTPVRGETVGRSSGKGKTKDIRPPSPLPATSSTSRIFPLSALNEAIPVAEASTILALAANTVGLREVSLCISMLVHC